MLYRLQSISQWGAEGPGSPALQPVNGGSGNWAQAALAPRILLTTLSHVLSEWTFALCKSHLLGVEHWVILLLKSSHADTYKTIPQRHFLLHISVLVQQLKFDNLTEGVEHREKPNGSPLGPVRWINGLREVFVSRLDSPSPVPSSGSHKVTG